MSTDRLEHARKRLHLIGGTMALVTGPGAQPEAAQLETITKNWCAAREEYERALKSQRN